MTSPNERLEQLQSLQNILIARATNGVADGTTYRALREDLVADPVLRDVLPSFVRTSRDLDQFWAYIKKDFTGYEARREHIWAAFAPAFSHIEGANNQPHPVAAASPSLASTLPPPAAPTPRATKAFISYSTKDKAQGALVKRLLAEYGIESFLAHDDIQVSEEWKERILEELLACDIFVPLLSTNFKASEWAPQEIGVVSGRNGVAIVPLSLDGTIPFGFISHIQGRRLPTSGANAGLLIEPLLKKWPRLILPGMIAHVRDAGSFRGAEAAMKPLVPYFGVLTDDELDALVDASIANNQVWSAGGCRVDYLPALIRANAQRIKPDKLTALQFQVDNDQRYYPPMEEV